MADAVEVAGMSGSADAFSLTFAVAKSDEEKRAVYGVLSVSKDSSGAYVIDSQGDIITEAELEKAAADFMLDSRKADTMHDQTRAGAVFESFVSTPEKRAAMGAGGDDASVYWWVGARVDPDTFALVKSGTLRSFSIGGTARREALNG